MQRRVRIDDTNKRNIRKVETLRNHLRAQQYLYVTAAELRQGAFVRPRTLHRVGVHP